MKRIPMSEGIVTSENRLAENRDSLACLAGQRCRMSEMYINQPKRWLDRKNRSKKRGTIVSTSLGNLIIRVKWDNVKTPLTYGYAYIEIDRLSNDQGHGLSPVAKDSTSNPASHG